MKRIMSLGGVLIGLLLLLIAIPSSGAAQVTPPDKVEFNYPSLPTEGISHYHSIRQFSVLPWKAGPAAVRDERR